MREEVAQRTNRLGLQRFGGIYRHVARTGAQNQMILGSTNPRISTLWNQGFTVAGVYWFLGSLLTRQTARHRSKSDKV